MLILLDILVIVSIKCNFVKETQSNSVGKYMTTTDELFVVPQELLFMVLCFLLCMAKNSHGEAQ